MSLYTRVFQRLGREYRRASFSGAVHRVFDLPPMARGSLPFSLISMVHPGDIAPYLLALRSFCTYANPQRVVVVCDPRMQPEHQALLRRSVPHVELWRAQDFQSPSFPIGGTWERLQAMAHLAQEGYTVQLDADTVTLGAPEEVLDCIETFTPFTLGEERGQQRIDLNQRRDSSESVDILQVHHVQAAAERMLPIASIQFSHYVRGCSGFFSLPSCGDYKEVMAEFSAEMQRLMGSRWHEWGTEQVTANYLVARWPEVNILSSPHYGTPLGHGTPPLFGHYIGSMRFVGPVYREAAVQALSALERLHSSQQDHSAGPGTLHRRVT